MASNREEEIAELKAMMIRAGTKDDVWAVVSNVDIALSEGVISGADHDELIQFAKRCSSKLPL